MMKARMSLTVLALLSAVLMTSGCAAVLIAGGAAAGAGTAVWYEGAVRTTQGYPLHEIQSAANEVLRQSCDGPVADSGTALDRELEGRLPNGDKVVIKLHYVSSTATEINIRIGFMGDELRSRGLLDKILERLKSTKV